MILPLIWRYLGRSYLHTLFLSIISFLALLLVSRFKEIAKFAALTGSFSKTLWFVVYQFPIILQIATPLSCLLAASLIMKKLSTGQEITSLRAHGLSLYSLLMPPLFASSFVSIFIFFLCASIAPYCQTASKIMLFEETIDNPLELLQRQSLIKAKHAHISMDICEENQAVASNALFIFYNPKCNRLCLMKAKEILTNESILEGKDTNLLIRTEGRQHEFDPLLIEHYQSFSMDAHFLSSFMKKSAPKLETSSLPLQNLSWKNRSHAIEFLRRISLSLSAFTFTFLGLVYNISFGRIYKSQLLKLSFISLLVLGCYLLGKELKSNLLLAVFVFFLPHFFAWSFSVLHLQSLTQGRR